MRVNWLTCWDNFREKVKTKNSWGKNELLELMEYLERQEVRKAENETN